jgi:hypothetical protein
MIMKIEYAQNPMASKIILDDADLNTLRDKCFVEAAEDLIASFYCDMKYRDMDIEDAYSKTFDSVEKQMRSEVNHYMDWLPDTATGQHVGDCTCVPSTCGRCMLENFLGIDTIEGLGKHEGAKISGYFNKHPDGTAKDCLEHMRNRTVEATEDWHKPHIERWKQELVNTIAWLEKYITEKLEEEL